MAEIDNLRQLFVRELADMLDAEHRVAGMLERLRDDTRDEGLREKFASHLDETRAHARHLEEVFGMLGEEPAAGRTAAFDGLDADHEARAGELSDELRDAFNAEAAVRAEHLEIAAYHALAAKAQALEHQDAASLLYENLRDEEQALQDVHAASERLLTMLGPGSLMP